jgi:hypothetical protein
MKEKYVDIIVHIIIAIVILVAVALLVSAPDVIIK